MRFRRALDREKVTEALSAASELGFVGLAEALELTLLLADKLNLYGSSLVRIPPEIGEMESLKEFVPYPSYRLHWFPYEITRCTKLRNSTVSTRALYGNFKFPPAFPRLDADMETAEGTAQPRETAPTAR